MKQFFKHFIFYQKKFTPALLIVSLTIFVWHKILSQMFLGEGYMYINPNQYLLSGKGFPKLWGYDNFARLFFQFLSSLFRENIQAYQIAALIVAIILFLTFYIVISKITKDKFVGFTATVFLSVNYVALFEYLAAGNYQRFIQRFPNFIPIFISFFFLWKYLNKKRLIYLLASLSLYTLAVLMGHFSILLLPFLIIFTIVQMFNNKITIRTLSSRIIICLVFTFISFYLTRHSEQSPAYNILSFFSIEKGLFERVVLQIPMVTVPLNLMNSFGKLFPELTSFSNATLIIFLIPCLILYFGGAILVVKRLPKLRSIYLTSLFSMFAVILLYIYVDPRLVVQAGVLGQNRYYLPPSFFAVIMWAIILKCLLFKKRVLYLLMSFGIMSIFIYYNTIAIWKDIYAIQYQSEMFKRFISYVKDHPNGMDSNSIIVAPYYLMWPAPLISQYISPGTEISLSSEGWEKNFWPQKNKVFVFDYDYQGKRGKVYDPRKGHLIDLTKKYRAGEKIVFLN